MTTVTINERTSKGKMLLEILRKFEGEEFINFQKKPNLETRRAISDVKKGKVIACENVEDMMNKLNARTSKSHLAQNLNAILKQ
jgi:hypothetical protein